nr:MAG TPA: hypothetical protein [Caudoviricetes sp.]
MKIGHIIFKMSILYKNAISNLYIFVLILGLTNAQNEYIMIMYSKRVRKLKTKTEV